MFGLLNRLKGMTSRSSESQTKSVRSVWICAVSPFFGCLRCAFDMTVGLRQSPSVCLLLSLFISHPLLSIYTGLDVRIACAMILDGFLF